MYDVGTVLYNCLSNLISWMGGGRGLVDEWRLVKIGNCKVRYFMGKLIEEVRCEGVL